MSDAMILVNLFFVPFVALWIYYKRNGVKQELNLNFILRYSMFAVYNILLTKVGIFIFRLLLGMDKFLIDSGYYTLLAFLSALSLPFLLSYGGIVYKKIVCKLNKLQMGKKTYVTTICILTILSLGLTLIPYYTNLSEHHIFVEVQENGNENRAGNEIKIGKIIVDGKSIKPENVFTEGGWFVAEDGLFTWRDYDFPAELEQTAYGIVQASHKIEVYFNANIWRGAAKVTIDDESHFVDCFYDSTTQNHWTTCTVYTAEYEKFTPLLLVRNLICIVLLIMLVVKAVIWINSLIEHYRSRTKAQLTVCCSDFVNKVNNVHIKRYLVIPALFIVLLVHAYITFSDRKLVSYLGDTTIEITPAFFYVRVGFLLVMSSLFLVCVLSKQLKIQNENRMYYWLCIGLVLCSLCIRYPIITWQAEPLVESCSNMLWQTYERGIAGSILLDDNGYLTLLPRLIAIISLFVFRDVQNAALIAQLFVLALFVFITAKIIKQEFSDYFCYEIRFVIALLLGTTPFIRHWEIVNLHNIGYYAIALMLLCCISDFKKVSWSILLLDSVIAALGCCSKLQGPVILPILIFVLIFSWKKISIKEKVFYNFCIAGCLIMVVYILAGVAEDIGLSGVETNIKVLCGASLKHTIQTFLFFLVPYNDSGYWGGIIINGLILTTLIICFYICIRRFERRSVICLSLLTYMIGCNLLMALSWRLQFNGFEDFFKATSFYSDRNNFLLVFSALLFLLVFLSGRFVSFANKRLLLSYCLLLLLIRFAFTSASFGAYVNTYEELNWRGYSVCLIKDTYGMPCLNDGKFMLKNAKVYAYTNAEPNKMDGHFFSGVSKHIQLDGNPVNMLFLGDTLSIVSVYAEKTYLLPEEEHIMLELRDCDGNVLQQVDAIGERDRYAIGFILDEPLDGVTSISFVNKDTGAEYFVASNIYVVVEAPNRGMSADAGWGINSLEE